VEERHLDPELVARGDHVFLSLVQLPCGREAPGVLAGVRVSHHDLQSCIDKFRSFRQKIGMIQLPAFRFLCTTSWWPLWFLMMCSLYQSMDSSFLIAAPASCKSFTVSNKGTTLNLFTKKQSQSNQTVNKMMALASQY